MSPCEWNPEADRPSQTGDDMHAAELSVGAKGEWHLCRKCAELPRFKRYKKRVELRGEG